VVDEFLCFCCWYWCRCCVGGVAIIAVAGGGFTAVDIVV